MADSIKKIKNNEAENFIIKNEIIPRACNMPGILKMEGLPPFNFAMKLEWYKYKSRISIEDVKEYLRLNRELIDEWIGYSADKRCAMAWYFDEDKSSKGGYIVGYYNNGRQDEVKYNDPIEACADFIIKELNGLF